MAKYVLLCLSILVWSVIPTPRTQAQADWSVYFYNPSTKEVIQIDSGGTQTTHALVVGENEIIATQVVVKNGKAAFCAVDIGNANTTSSGPDSNNGQARPPARFYIQDLANGATLVANDLGSIECNLGPGAFNADASQVAFGILDAENSTWQLSVVDSTSGEILHTLNVIPDELEDYYMPNVRYFAEDTISFVMLMWFSGGAPVNPAYTWNLADDSVVVDANWGQFNVVYLPATDEMIWTAFDESRPAGSPAGPLPSNNVVRYNDMTGTESTIFYSGDMLPTETRFIDNGNALAIHLLASFDPANEEASNGSKWVRLDRDGTVTDLTEMLVSYSDIVPIPNGYILNTYEPNPDGTPTILLSFQSPDLTVDVYVEEGYQPVFLAGYAGYEINPGDVQSFTALQ